ncbi:tripartite tricarboxylate transporter substrate-binding protein, partial [Acinetobacter baumannii]|nr:tripartite tricarboxylate transporter substrate-binding protein [Acinetobacter baumannii]MCW1766879.1 tripartite tricarboxylate transporter substrate-binding protein [Acinetobacter baumannii]
PDAAGGAVDHLARALDTRLNKVWSQPVVILNRTGANEIIGAEYVAKSAPDGYTLFVGANNELAIARLINKSIKYSIGDFTPIGMIGSQPMVLVASQKAGVKTAAEFSALVAQNPGKFSYGSSGVGTALHLAG